MKTTVSNSDQVEAGRIGVEPIASEYPSTSVRVALETFRRSFFAAGDDPVASFRKAGLILHGAQLERRGSWVGPPGIVLVVTPAEPQLYARDIIGNEQLLRMAKAGGLSPTVAPRLVPIYSFAYGHTTGSNQVSISLYNLAWLVPPSKLLVEFTEQCSLRPVESAPVHASRLSSALDRLRLTLEPYPGGVWRHGRLTPGDANTLLRAEAIREFGRIPSVQEYHEYVDRISCREQGISTVLAQLLLWGISNSSFNMLSLADSLHDRASRLAGLLGARWDFIPTQMPDPRELNRWLNRRIAAEIGGGGQAADQVPEIRDEEEFLL